VVTCTRPHWRRSAAAAFTLAMIPLLVGTTISAQTGSGSISGHVLDASTRTPLAGAQIAVNGSSARAAADRNGAFRLPTVPSGTSELVVSYIGHQTQRASVTLEPGGSVDVEVALPAEYMHRETVTVVAAPIEQETASALNEQRVALNITNMVSADDIGAFPDPNAAEATQRIPGISIQRDQGEGRYVMIRGTEPRLNSMMIDGERIPSPEKDVRQVALDVIPADLLQSIQVSKAITPDMDGDSIGGAVNLITKQADKTRVLFSAGGGYNRLVGSSDQPNVTGAVGGRFAEGRMGLMVTGSALKSTRGSDDFEPAYTPGLALASNSLRDYHVTRKRYGFNAAFDTKLGDATTLFVRALGNSFSDQEYRQQVKQTVSSGRIDRQLKDRLETQHIVSLATRGQHLFPGGATLDLHVSTAYGDEGEPNHQDTTFRQSKVSFAPNVTATSIDPNNIQANPLNEDLTKYTLNSIVITDGLTRDRDVVASGDLRIPLSSTSTTASVLKAGLKYRRKHKFYDVTITNMTSAAPVGMASFLDAGTQIGIYDGRYPMGSPINAGAVRAIPSQYTLTSSIDHVKGDPSNYNAHEDVFAAYAMAELYLTPKLVMVPGVRFESTGVDYRGNRISLGSDGAWLSTSPVTGGDRYGVPLPMAHLRYAIDDRTNIRAAFTRTLARADYVDLVPSETVNLQNYTISRGNPDLQPTTSWNYDLMAEHYFKSVGIMSAGLFAKQIEKYIYPSMTEVSQGDDLYRVTQPQNGQRASVRGLECAFQNQLTFLPGPLAGIGAYANYAYTSSSAKFLGREGEEGTLPGQAKHVGNLSVWYERYGFSGRLSYNYHGSFVDTVGDSAATDVYYDSHKQMDVSFGQAVTKNVRVFFDILNLTNAPLRYYIGTADRPIQNESYRWWMMFGLKMNF
jgi:TonB-dependent receptor